MKLLNGIKYIIKHKWILILLIAIIVQIIIAATVYGTLKNNENNDIAVFVEKNGKSIIREFNSVHSKINYIVRRNDAIMAVNGKYIIPEVFETYIQSLSIPVVVNIRYERWFPRITLDERKDFEAFANENVQDNFMIRDVLQVFPEIIYETAENRSEYFPFTVSVPAFFGLLGGDSYNTTSGKEAIDKTIENGSPTVSDRTRLFELNSTINYALRIRSPVYKFNTSEYDRDNLLGLTEILYVPNDILNEVIDRQNIDHNNVDIFIYDLSSFVDDADSLIHREDNVKYQNYNDRSKISELMKLNNIYSTIVNITNRQYSVSLKFDDGFVDNERTFFPEGILITICILCLAIDIISIIIYHSYVNNIESKTKDMKYSVLSNVNHNMRNPLNGIKGTIETMIVSLTLLLKPDDDNFDIRKNKLNNLEDTNFVISTHELRDSYVNPLIDVFYACIQLANTIYSVDYVTDVIMGNSKSTYSKITIENMIEYVNNIISNDINENHNLNYYITVIDPKMEISTDIDRACQILVIFLRNAFQYTFEGDIRLNITKSENYIVFNVSDTGIGVPIDIVDKLFKEKKIKPHVIGSGGLGTYHAKLIADSINASVGYDRLENGSNFYLKIPIIANNNGLNYNDLNGPEKIITDF